MDVRALRPETAESSGSETIIEEIVPRGRDLGGFSVKRVLPTAKRKTVGPFIFFDHMGPVDFPPGQGINVRPHPHIGLATVTYLFEGELRHQDSLGSDQMIYPGAVNWMIAGRGITHSERTSPTTRAAGSRLCGIQTWVALPKAEEERAPAFEHHVKETLPAHEDDARRLRLILGHAYGAEAPVRTFSDMFYLDAELRPGAALALPEDHEERAVYIAEGSLDLGGAIREAGRMLIFASGRPIAVRAGPAGARLMLLGGAPFGEKRFIWWNFVSSSQARIEQAKEDWRQGRFPLPPGDKEEFIPLPEA